MRHKGASRQHRVRLARIAQGAVRAPRVSDWRRHLPRCNDRVQALRSGFCSRSKVQRELDDPPSLRRRVEDCALEDRRTGHLLQGNRLCAELHLVVGVAPTWSSLCLDRDEAPLRAYPMDLDQVDDPRQAKTLRTYVNGAEGLHPRTIRLLTGVDPLVNYLARGGVLVVDPDADHVHERRTPLAVNEVGEGRYGQVVVSIHDAPIALVTP